MIEKLGKNAFLDRKDLIEFEIPDGIKRIGESCFENCVNLRKIKIPCSVVGIHKSAFCGCEQLTEISLPENLQNIAESTFSGCKNLEKILIPNAVRFISNKAFYNCSALEEVVFHGSEMKISQSAFEGCTALRFDCALSIAEHFVKPLDLLIHNRANGIEGRLRTFEPRTFEFDGVNCASIESVLESFKFEDIFTQRMIAQLPSWDAYHEGQCEEAKKWQITKILHWNGTDYHRDGEEYQKLLRRLFISLFEQDPQFRLDMAFLKNASVRMKVGGTNPETQVLTKHEFLTNLLAFSNSNDPEAVSIKTENYNGHGKHQQKNQDVTKTRKKIVRDQASLEAKKNKHEIIVVMGGSFNPPTIAHEKLLISAVNTLSANQGIFVPSSDAYVRRKMRRCAQNLLLSEEQRFEMLQAICRKDSRLSVSSCEYQDDGKGHTFDTLQKIQEEHPDALLCFLIGSDKLSIIPKWHQWRSFFEKFDFAVVKRNETDPEAYIMQHPILSAYNDIFHMVKMPDGIEAISSTAVREMLKAGNPVVKDLLNEEVYEMLSENARNSDITSFRGEFDFLSNFYEAEVDYRGVRYLNNEAAFQAQKCTTEEEKLTFASLSAAKAKRKGRQVEMRADWDQIKVPFMEEIVRSKFTQHPEIACRLLATGERKIVEGNSWGDTFWGVDSRTGKGENHLGRVLMKIRSELQMMQ